jgi:hypothetical protein
LPKLNLYEIGYLLTNSVVRLVLPGGFGGDPQTWESIASDIATTFNGLLNKLVGASGGASGTLIAIVLSAISLRVLSVLAHNVVSRWPEPSTSQLIALPSLAAGVVAIGSAYDEWRSQFFAIPPLSLAGDWTAFTTSYPWVRLCAPEVAAAFVFAIQGARLCALRRRHNA